MEANFMQSGNFYNVGYNIQMGVNGKHHFIVMTRVTQNAADHGNFITNIEYQKEEIGIEPIIAAADTGYYKILDIFDTSIKTERFIDIPEDKNIESGFVFSKIEDHWTCPEGKILKHYSKKTYSKLEYKIYRTDECEGCKNKPKVCKNKNKENQNSRTIIRSEVLEEYKSKMREESSKRIFERRFSTSEHVFGTIKMLFGKLGFIGAGLKIAEVEMDLVSAAYNIKRLINLNKSRKKENSNQIPLIEQLEIYFKNEKMAI